MSATTDADIAAARERGDALALNEPRAAAARYDATTGRVIVALLDAPRVIGRDALLAVQLDNGEWIHATPDHDFVSSPSSHQALDSAE